MSNCHYCNGTGYESVKVKKYDGAMNEHYETYENHMCQYCGGKGYYPKANSSTEKAKSPQQANSSKKIIPKESDVTGTIASISIVLAVIVAYYTFHNPSIKLNWIASSVIVFIASNIILHIVYEIFIAMSKLAEFVLAIAFWGAVITGVSYAAGADWALNLVSQLN